MPSVDPVVLVPVKAFADAKARLATALSPAERESLARYTATRVLAAAAPAAVYVACDDDSVAQWASDHGAHVLWHPSVGLNRAIGNSVADLVALGAPHVVIAHGDLPRATGLAALAAAGCITLVPDHAGDGTNVLSLPLPIEFGFSYGVGSFRRHLAAALASGLRVRVRRDPLLALDIDTPHDLTHPLVQEGLPEWLRTNQANRPPAPR
ncbi:MAG: hypothetical protein RI900_2550 [Actinomycetota bacterium]|jgi:2-phospho-L-lactate guanylyltransferase